MRASVLLAFASRAALCGAESISTSSPSTESEEEYMSACVCVLSVHILSPCIGSCEVCMLEQISFYMRTHLDPTRILHK